MSKGRYVNFARKKKFKDLNFRHTSSEDGRGVYLQHTAGVNGEVCQQRQERTVKHSELNLSTKEEETEIKSLLQCYQNSSLIAEELKTFDSFPLSKRTLAALKELDFVKPTTIQRDSILSGLRGEDILAAAKTGSGKTLAFLIPVLERLYTNKWTRLDGLGALIITPTRELALQIFEMMMQVGKHHDVTTGLIIGGQNLKFERNRLHNLNIIVSTPGRLLQHMDQNPLFDATNLKMLVLDEADRCLDMGFASTMDAIIENLPISRQTLLFSATQTKSVQDLARVNLKNARHIAPHEHESIATPMKLEQSYVVVELHEKLTMLWSFLRAHPKQKIIVFFATCKQVKYVYQILKKLRPANMLLPLYGGMNQKKRNTIYAEFCSKNNNVCLLATDVASRGLDFPRVNWVIQMDCPEDVTQYIHRAGRTARLNTNGESLLVLLPHEETAMLESLAERKIPIKNIKIDERQLFSPLLKIQSLLAQSPELKECAKRAFIAYIKSVVLMKNRQIFRLDEVNLDEYAKSLGLNVTPRVRFLSRVSQNRKQEYAVNSSTDVRIASYSDEEHSDDDNFLQVKRVDHCPDQSAVGTDNENRWQSETSVNILKKRVSKAKMVKKSLVVGKRTVFNEHGISMTEDGTETTSYSYDIDKARLELHHQDAADKERYKNLKKIKRHTQKEKAHKQKVDSGEDENFSNDSDASGNLDWLPDPDKVYGKKNQRKVSSDNEANELQCPLKKKRTLLNKAQDLTLKETEELAINLLQK